MIASDLASCQTVIIGIVGDNEGIMMVGDGRVDGEGLVWAVLALKLGLGLGDGEHEAGKMDFLEFGQDCGFWG